MSTTARRIALITGSTDGLGRSVARSLAASGFLVLIHGRDPMRGDDVVRGIGAKGGTARFHPADFASLAAVRQLAAAVCAGYDRLDLLINNAGIGTGDGGRPAPRQTSADGHELRFAVNYLADPAPVALDYAQRAGPHRQRRVGRPVPARFRQSDAG